MKLVIDLDHTFLKGDCLHEALASLLLTKPWIAFWALFLLISGKQAQAKVFLSRYYSPQFHTNMINPQLLDWLHMNFPKYEKTFLVSASPQQWVDLFKAPFGFFNAAFGTTGTVNLKSEEKLRFIQQHIGADFVYAGDSTADFPIWKSAKGAIVVGSSQLVKSVEKLCPLVAHIPVKRSPLHFLRLLRPHQWAKNILIFVPLLLAKTISVASLTQALIAFCAFSLTASIVYVINDVIDLPNDRTHSTKFKRPLAASLVSPLLALAALPFLAVGVVGLTQLLPTQFAFVLAFYFVLTTAYSFSIKKQAILDVILLAILYTLRLIAGGSATETVITPWLMIFSIFFFLSLAMVKRFTELLELSSTPAQQPSLNGRGYFADDLPVVRGVGISTAMMSLLVFSLYLQETSIATHYKWPQLMWGVNLCLVYWLSYVWLKAGRGQMHDDPVVFALKDKTSRWVGLLALTCVFAALFFDRGIF